MLRFIASGDDGLIRVGFGLSRGNIDRLIEGKPILIDLGTMHPELKAEVLIFFGETEEAMMAELKREGAFSPETKTRVDPIDPHIEELIGATGNYPAGKDEGMPNDEGELRAALTADRKANRVRIHFGKEITWLGLTAEEALIFAEKLRFAAGKLRR